MKNVIHTRVMHAITSMELQVNSRLGQKPFPLNSSNLVRIHLFDGVVRELGDPQLNLDYLAGVLEDRKTFGIFKLSMISQVEFTSTCENSSNRLITTRDSIGKQISSLPTPCTAKLYWLIGQLQPRVVRVFGTARGFVFLDNNQSQAVPISTLAAIELYL